MRPAALLLWASAVLVLVGVAASVWDAVLPWFLGASGLLAVWALWDWVRLRRVPQPKVERVSFHSLPLGEWGRVTLRIESQATRRLELDVFDHHPSEMQVEGQPWRLSLAAGGAAELAYRLRPTARGEWTFQTTQVVVSWRGCLWARSLRCGAPASVKVYPNFKAVARHALHATEDQVRQMGIRRRRQRGTGLDFHQMREYREGDSLRQIDWKATSRHRKLVSREYQEERDQRVVFVLDCGRRMHARDGDLSHFDHALNAVLLLAYVALRQGDSVGFLTFSGMERWLAPVKGAGAMTTVLNQVYDLHTTMQPSDYVEAAQRVMRNQPRRALVILVTNLREEDAAEVQPALRMLRERHLVLLASLRETVVQGVLEAGVNDLDDALRLVMARQYLADRRVTHERVGGFGIQVLDVEPAELPPALVDRYLDIKRVGSL